MLNKQPIARPSEGEQQNERREIRDTDECQMLTGEEKTEKALSFSRKEEIMLLG
jgi:hypothetical protein